MVLTERAVKPRPLVLKQDLSEPAAQEQKLLPAVVVVAVPQPAVEVEVVAALLPAALPVD